MEGFAWLNVCYPGGLEIDNKGCLSFNDDRIRAAKAFPFRVPKNISFADLYDKLITRLNIDSNLYEMVLGSPNPFSSKYPPFEINDDETVDWLISQGQINCLHVNLKSNANEVGGTSRRVIPMHNEGEDINCIAIDNVEDDDTNWRPEIIMNDNVDVAVSPLAGVTESVSVGVGVDVSDTLSVPVDDSCLIPVNDTSHVAEDMTEVCADSLSDGLNAIEPTGVTEQMTDVCVDIEPTGAVECDNVIPGSSDILPVSSWRIPFDKDLHSGDEFSTKDALALRLQEIAIAHHFQFTTKYSDTKRVLFICANNLCSWRLRATPVGASSKKFVVGIYESNHSCPLVIHHTYHRQANSNFVCNDIAGKFLGSTHSYTAKEIMRDFQAKFAHKLSKKVAYNAQKKAKASIRGTPSENFMRLPKFFHALEMANPDTKTYIETDREDVFKYCFMALGQCIRGYSSSIRPVICVDGTFLTGAWRGTLLEAVCQDGQRGLYPLAFALVKSENNLSWAWFFEKLKTITGDTSEVVILSDRAPSIKNGFEKVFENAHYGNCCIHMKRNLLSRYPNCNLSYLFTKAYKAYTVHEFQEFFDLLCEKVRKPGKDRDIDESEKDCDIDKYLPKDEFRYWSRAHFDGHRYHMMTTNPAESFNSLLKKAREFPVVALLNKIRSILQDWFADRNVEAQGMTGVLTPKMQKRMDKRYDQMREANLKCEVIRRGSEYEVLIEDQAFVVDMVALTCTCKKFDLKKFPCIHALFVAIEINKPFPTLCSEYHYSSFYKTAYSEAIYPPLNENEIEYPESVLTRKVVPPDMSNGKGRPGNKRKKGAGEPRGAGEKRKRKKANALEVHPGETCNEPHEHTVAPEEQPRKHRKNKLQKRKTAKQCSGSGEQPGGTSNEHHEQTVALEEQPREPRKKKKTKKFARLDDVFSREDHDREMKRLQKRLEEKDFQLQASSSSAKMAEGTILNK